MLEINCSVPLGVVMLSGHMGWIGRYSTCWLAGLGRGVHIIDPSKFCHVLEISLISSLEAYSLKFLFKKMRKGVEER